MGGVVVQGSSICRAGISTSHVVSLTATHYDTSSDAIKANIAAAEKALCEVKAYAIDMCDTLRKVFFSERADMQKHLSACESAKKGLLKATILYTKAVSLFCHSTLSGSPDRMQYTVDPRLGGPTMLKAVSSLKSLPEPKFLLPKLGLLLREWPTETLAFLDGMSSSCPAACAAVPQKTIELGASAAGAGLTRRIFFPFDTVKARAAAASATIDVGLAANMAISCAHAALNEATAAVVSVDDGLGERRAMRSKQAYAAAIEHLYVREKLSYLASLFGRVAGLCDGRDMDLQKHGDMDKDVYEATELVWQEPPDGEGKKYIEANLAAEWASDAADIYVKLRKNLQHVMALRWVEGKKESSRMYRSATSDGESKEVSHFSSSPYHPVATDVSSTSKLDVASVPLHAHETALHASTASSSSVSSMLENKSLDAGFDGVSIEEHALDPIFEIIPVDESLLERPSLGLTCATSAWNSCVAAGVASFRARHALTKEVAKKMVEEAKLQLQHATDAYMRALDYARYLKSQRDIHQSVKDEMAMHKQLAIDAQRIATLECNTAQYAIEIFLSS